MTTPATAWMTQANCRGKDVKVFFPALSATTKAGLQPEPAELYGPPTLCAVEATPDFPLVEPVPCGGCPECRS